MGNGQAATATLATKKLPKDLRLDIALLAIEIRTSAKAGYYRECLLDELTSLLEAAALDDDLDALDVLIRDGLYFHLGGLAELMDGLIERAESE